jgi:anti-anti-sigma regulatory factor
MKITDFDLKSMLDFQPSAGKLLLGGDRMLLFRQDAFASLRKLLFEQLGEQLSRALLMQFGYRCGHGDHHALTTRFSWDTDLDEMSAGPVMHTWEGIVHVEPTMLVFDKAKGEFHMTGIWRNSYEAEVHIHEFGISEVPVCHSLTGYASGWCTAFLGKPLLAIETMCAGKGDPHCQFEIRVPEAWGSEAEMWRSSLVATDYSISRELVDKLSTIERQRVAISQLSSPIIQVWEGVLTIPIVGQIDPGRAALLLEDLLSAVLRTRARYAILDLTGVDVVDTSAVDHFFKILGAVELLGARCIMTGIKPAVAQTMISLGIDMNRMTTMATLEDALQSCLRGLGFTVTRDRSRSR